MVWARDWLLFEAFKIAFKRRSFCSGRLAGDSPPKSLFKVVQYVQKMF